MSIFCDETAPENIVKSSSPRIFTTYCLFHLGDHIYNMNLFRQMEDLLRETNRKIHYYCPSQYHEQVAEFSPSSDVFELFAMCDLDRDAILDKGLVPGGFSPLHELHIGNQRLPKHLFNRTHANFDQFYEEFYGQFLETWFSKEIAETYPISFIAKKDPDLVSRYENLPQKYKDLDILFINSTPMSHQYFRPGITWDKYILNASNLGLKIATTAPLSRRPPRGGASPPCTIDDKLTIKNIAAISTRAKNIIAINTGPLSGCFNEITMDYVDKIYVFDKGNTFIHKKVVSCEKIEDIQLSNFCGGGGAARELKLRKPKPVRKIGMGF